MKFSLITTACMLVLVVLTQCWPTRAVRTQIVPDGIKGKDWTLTRIKLVRDYHLDLQSAYNTTTPNCQFKYTFNERGRLDVLFGNKPLVGSYHFASKDSLRYYGGWHHKVVWTDSSSVCGPIDPGQMSYALWPGRYAYKLNGDSLVLQNTLKETFVFKSK
jgi:hypothetical protein